MMSEKPVKPTENNVGPKQLTELILTQRKLLPATLYIYLAYVSSFMVYGVLFPFLPLILHAKRFSDAETAFVMSASGMAALLAPLLFAHLADRSIQFRKLMPLLLLSAGGALALLHFDVTPLIAFVIVFFVYFFLVPAVSLLDPFTLDFINRNPSPTHKQSFTSYRIWGSIGFMCPAIGLGWYFRSNDIPTSFMVTLAVSAAWVSALSAYGLPANQPSSKTGELPSREALSVALRPPLRGLFAANFFASSALSLFYTIQPRFLQEIGCPTAQVGLIINLGVLAEVILMPFAGRIIKVIGLSNLILFAMLTIPVRLFLIATWPTILVATLTQLLHGPLVLGLIIGIPLFLQENAKDSFRHSLQSINTTVGLGLTRVTGPIIGMALVNSSSTSADLPGLVHAIFISGVLGMVAASSFWLSNHRN